MGIPRTVWNTLLLTALLFSPVLAAEQTADKSGSAQQAQRPSTFTVTPRSSTRVAAGRPAENAPAEVPLFFSARTSDQVNPTLRPADADNKTAPRTSQTEKQPVRRVTQMRRMKVVTPVAAETAAAPQPPQAAIPATLAPPLPSEPDVPQAVVTTDVTATAAHRDEIPAAPTSPEAVPEPTGVVAAAFDDTMIPGEGAITPVAATVEDDALPEFSDFEEALPPHAENAFPEETAVADEVPAFPDDFEADLPEQDFQFDDTSADDMIPAAPEAAPDHFDVQKAVPNAASASLPDVHTGAQQPTVEVRWSGHETLNLGQECPCALIATNMGNSLVRNVTVEAAIPEGIDVVQATPAPQAGTSRWSVGDLEPGQSAQIDLTMIPRQRGDLALNAFVRFTGFSTSVISVQEPMLAVSVEGPASVTVGEQSGYVVRVENPGTGPVQNVVIEAEIPEGLQHRSGRTPRILVGTLNPGESRQARLNLTALTGGEQQLMVRTVADGGLSDRSSQEITVAEPSLEIAVSGPETASAGSTETYELLVTNTGNIPSINVRAKYKLPQGTSFVKADRGGVHKQDEHVVDWFVGTLQPGETAAYRVALQAAAPGDIEHRAGVVSEHTAVTVARHTTRIQGIPELRLAVTTDRPASAVGEDSIVQISVHNSGSVSAERVGLNCELPSGLQFVAAQGPSDHLAENGMVMFRSVDGIAAGETATWRLKVRCVRNGKHPIRVRSASRSLADPVIGEAVVATTPSGR